MLLLVLHLGLASFVLHLGWPEQTLVVQLMSSPGSSELLLELIQLAEADRLAWDWLGSWGWSQGTQGSYLLMLMSAGLGSQQ